MLHEDLEAMLKTKVEKQYEEIIARKRHDVHKRKTLNEIKSDAPNTLLTGL